MGKAEPVYPVWLQAPVFVPGFPNRGSLPGDTKGEACPSTVDGHAARYIPSQAIAVRDPPWTDRGLGIRLAGRLLCPSCEMSTGFCNHIRWAQPTLQTIVPYAAIALTRHNFIRARPGGAPTSATF